MAATLVIKSADFFENKLATVTFSTVPCTGIMLNESSHLLNQLGDSVTLLATIEPADCTERVIWTTSNESVAVVSNGVVTSVGVGDCVITATCGSYSASCSITAKAFMEFTGVVKTYTTGDGTHAGSDGAPRLNYNANSYKIRASLVASSGTLSFYNVTEGVRYYPYKIPKNTKQIKVTMPTSTNGIKVAVVLFCSVTVSMPGYPSVAQLIDKAGSITTSNGIATVDIPTYDGYPEVDAIAINVQMSNGTSEFLQEYFDDVTVEFLPAA